MAKMLISQIIGGLSLFGRAVRQGGDDARSFSTNMRALNATTTMQRATKSVTQYLKQFDMSLQKNGRDYSYSIKENIAGQLNIYKVTSEGVKEVSKLFNLSKNQLRDNLDDLAGFLRDKGFQIEDIDLNVEGVQKTVDDGLKKVFDPKGLEKLFSGSFIGKLLGKDKGFKAETETMRNEALAMPTGTPEQNKAKMDKIDEVVKRSTIPESKGSKMGGILNNTIGLPFKALGVGGKIAGKGIDLLGRGVSKLTGVPTEKIKAGAAMFKSAAMPMLKGMAMGAMLDVVMQLIDALNPFKPLLAALVTIFGVYGAILSEAFMPLIEKLFDIMLSPAVLTIIEMLSQALMQLIMAFLPLLDILGPILMVPLMILVAVMQGLALAITFLATPLQAVGVVFAGIVAWLSQIVLSWQLYVNPIFLAIASFFTVTIPNAFKFLANAVIWIINDIIKAINLVIPGTEWDISLITPLAKGGLVMGPTRALVGEAGPELVLPLDKIGSMGVTINIHGDITEHALFKLNRQLLINNVY